MRTHNPLSSFVVVVLLLSGIYGPREVRGQNQEHDICIEGVSFEGVLLLNSKTGNFVFCDRLGPRFRGQGKVKTLNNGSLSFTWEDPNPIIGFRATTIWGIIKPENGVRSSVIVNDSPGPLSGVGDTRLSPHTCSCFPPMSNAQSVSSAKTFEIAQGTTSAGTLTVATVQQESAGVEKLDLHEFPPGFPEQRRSVTIATGQIIFSLSQQVVQVGEKFCVSFIRVSNDNFQPQVSCINSVFDPLTSTFVPGNFAETDLTVFRGELLAYGFNKTANQAEFFRSPDGGQTWQPFDAFKGPAGATILPALLGGKHGRLAVTPDGNKWGFLYESHRPGQSETEIRVRVRPEGRAGPIDLLVDKDKPPAGPNRFIGTSFRFGPDNSALGTYTHRGAGEIRLFRAEEDVLDRSVQGSVQTFPIGPAPTGTNVFTTGLTVSEGGNLILVHPPGNQRIEFNVSNPGSPQVNRVTLPMTIPSGPVDASWDHFDFNSGSSPGCGTAAKRYSLAWGGSLNFATISLPTLPTLYFAQFADGGGISSGITLSNLSIQQTKAKILLKDREGNPLAVDLNGQNVNGQLEVSIPPSGRRSFQTDGQGSVVVGSVTVESDHELSGVVLFGGSFGRAGVGSSQALERGFTAPIDVNSATSVNTGVAIMNLENRALTLELQLCDNDNKVLATAQLTIPARGQRALFVTEIRWNTSVNFTNFQGILKANPNGRTAATVVQTRPDQIATLPVSAR